MAGTIARSRLAGIAVAHAACFGLTLWLNYRFGVGILALLPISLGTSCAAAWWAWGRDWRNEIGLARPRRWSEAGLLAGFLCVVGFLILGPPRLRVLEAGHVLDATATSLSEEVAFRGVLLGLLLPLVPRAAAVLLSSVIFGAVHLFRVFRGVELSDVAVVVALTSALGLAFCSFRLRSSLWVAIAAHALWNIWARAGSPNAHLSVSPGPAGMLWASGAIASAAIVVLLAQARRPYVLVGFVGVTAAMTWNAMGPLGTMRQRRAALESCADWGVNDIADFSSKPLQRELWHWAPSARKERIPEPRRDLELLQRREAIAYLRHVATRDPDGRLRVAAVGLLVRMVDHRVPGWIEEGRHEETCWSLLEALQAPQTGGAKAGPESYGLLTLLRTVVERDPDLGRAMVAALLARFDSVDRQSALCFANAIRQSTLDLAEFRDDLLGSVRAGGEASAPACACILAYMGEEENRSLVEEALERCSEEHSVREALRHLRTPR